MTVVVFLSFIGLWCWIKSKCRVGYVWNCAVWSIFFAYVFMLTISFCRKLWLYLLDVQVNPPGLGPQPTGRGIGTSLQCLGARCTIVGQSSLGLTL